MRQKVALTAAHLLSEGRAADMGMGSGSGSRALAALYPRLEVVGVEKGFAFSRVEGVSSPPLQDGWRRYRLTRKLAAEFLLRKDYRTDWAAEVQEEYTYFSQAQFEALFQKLGLRVLASTPIWNPWIARNRYRGKALLWSDSNAPLDFPPTNYVIVGERVPAGEGVRFRQAEAAPPLGFLALEFHRHRRSGDVRDLVRRPNLTVDVVPFFREHGDLFVVARMSYPRPILKATERAEAALDQATAAEYVTEPLNVLLTDKPIGQTVEETLAAHASVPAERIRQFLPGTSYYPSPGGTQEEVRSIFVEIDPLYAQPVSATLSSGHGPVTRSTGTRRYSGSR